MRILALLAFIFSLNCYSQNNNLLALQDFELVSGVKSICISVYDSEESFGEPKLLNKKDFNSKNESIFFDTNGYIEKINRPSFFSERDSTGAVNCNSYFNVFSYQYDQNKKVKKIIKNDGGVYNPISGKKSENSYREFFYNETNEVIRIDHINTLGKLEFSTRIKYSSNKKTEMTYDTNGKLLWGTKHSNNNLVDSLYEINPSKKITSITVIEHNEKRLPIEERKFSTDGKLLLQWNHSYNAKNNLKKTTFIDFEDNEKKVTEYTYDYDSQGNWIQKNEFINNELKVSLIRRIKYY